MIAADFPAKRTKGMKHMKQNIIFTRNQEGMIN